MIDVEFRIVSESREGLLLQLGRAVAVHGFALQRPRMTRIENGVVLTVIARGPDAKLLALQDSLGTHPMVHSFEASEPNEILGDTVLPTALAAPTQPKTAPAETGGAMAEKTQIESVLASLVTVYPNVLDRILAFERSLPASQRDATLSYAGSRLGAWMFKRDYALGARLALGDSLKNIAVPALRRMLRGIELFGESIHVSDSPFCGPGAHRGPSCQFLSGCLQGLLSEPGHLGRVRVTETGCRNTGAKVCSFLATV